MAKRSIISSWTGDRLVIETQGHRVHTENGFLENLCALCGTLSMTLSVLSLCSP
jgi:hypothetical protein